MPRRLNVEDNESNVLLRCANFVAASRVSSALITSLDDVPLVSLRDAVKPLRSVVPAIDRMVDKVEQEPTTSNDGLTPDEIFAIKLYTLEWKPSTKSFYYIFNKALRCQKQSDLIVWCLYLRLILHALDKLSPSTHNILYRGVAMNLIHEYPQNKDFIWKPFTSCTSALGVVSKYIDARGAGTIFNIEAHSAKDISQYSWYANESEALCPPGCHFRVVACCKLGNKNYIVHLKEIEAIAPVMTIPPMWTTAEPLPSLAVEPATQLHVSLQRAAINPDGHLGSLYDVNHDLLLERLKIHGEKSERQMDQTVHCKIFLGDRFLDQNLLEAVEFQDELKVSLLLIPPPKKCLASLIDYALPIDRYTRVIHYLYCDRVKEIHINLERTTLPTATTATHVITKIAKGIEFLAVLQLPDDDNLVWDIDQALDNVRTLLKGKKPSSLTENDERLLKSILETKIYSNTPQLMAMTSVIDLCHCNHLAKKKYTLHQPLSYALESIKHLFPQLTPSTAAFTLLSPEINHQLENYLLQAANTIKQSTHALEMCAKSLPSADFLPRLQAVRSQWQALKEAHTDELKRFRETVLSVRKTTANLSEIDTLLDSARRAILVDHAAHFIEQIDQIQARGQLIIDLGRTHVQYCNVASYFVSGNDDPKSIRRKLAAEGRYDRILCSSDALNVRGTFELQRFTRERQTNPNLRLLYADFSCCAIELPETLLITPDSHTRPARSSSAQCLNILLLGDTNVDKSALINYRKFPSFEQAVASGALVDEHPYNDADATQRCRSYVFRPHHPDGQTVRFIDTPSFNQDEQALEHILAYINTFPHLHAVCLLFNSRNIQSSKFLPICLKPLLDFLGPNAIRNFLVCLMDTEQSTSAAFEDIIPLFESIGLPLTRESIFTFDTVPHDNTARWETATNELNRLIKHVSERLVVCHLQGNHQSFKHARLEIRLLLRPILEAIRQMFRTIISGSSNGHSVGMRARSVYRPAYTCLVCQLTGQSIGNVWVVDHTPHEMHGSCLTCPCSPDEHQAIDYVLEYELVSQTIAHHPWFLKNMCAQLMHACAQFSYFLMNVVGVEKDDLFLLGLTRMIEVENHFNLTQKPSSCSQHLINELQRFTEEYRLEVDKIKINHQYDTLPNIYKSIRAVQEYPMIQEQVAAARQSRAMIAQQGDLDQADMLR